MQQNQATILTGGNAIYVSELYARFAADPSSVDTAWAEFFAGLGDDGRSVLAELKGPPWGRNGAQVIGLKDEAPLAPPAKRPAAAAPTGAPSVEELRRATTDSVRALMLVRAYRARGHFAADLDPLGLAKRPPAPELDCKVFGVLDQAFADLDDRRRGRRQSQPGRQFRPKQFIRQNPRSLRIILELHDIIRFVRAAQQLRLRSSAHSPDLFHRERHRARMLAIQSGLPQGKHFKMGNVLWPHLRGESRRSFSSETPRWVDRRRAAGP